MQILQIQSSGACSQPIGLHKLTVVKGIKSQDLMRYKLTDVVPLSTIITVKTYSSEGRNNFNMILQMLPKIGQFHVVPDTLFFCLQFIKKVTTEYYKSSMLG